MNEFVEFKKIPRLSRECVVTEKIDGTNGVICIIDPSEILIGSRTRWLDEHTDNYGFHKWAMEHKEELLKLGVGTHYGEWWGNGIQRGYGLPKGEKRFSLFNVERWCLSTQEPKLISIDPRTKEERWQNKLPSCCGLVPILWTGIFDTTMFTYVLSDLIVSGSKASPGFMNPEGIVIYHKAGNLMFKKTIEKDDKWKGEK
jgi:hypothetical protein